MASSAEKSKEHLGHFLLEGFTTYPDHVNQIDAATGESRTNAEVYSHVVSLARAIMNFGLKTGDVITYAGRNILDIRLPYYAGMMIGCPIAGVDPSYKFLEIKDLFEIAKPKLSFCEREDFEDTSRAVQELNLGTVVVVFGDGDNSLKTFLKVHGGDDKEDFQLPNFDPERTFAWLISTSGTSGRPKLAAYYHKPVLDVMRLCVSFFSKSGKGVSLLLTPVQWMTAYFTTLLSVMNNSTILQTSAPATAEHLIDVINEYKPTTTMMGPRQFTQLLRHPKKCDLSSFSFITLAGSKIHNDLMQEVRSKVGKGCDVVEMYGQSETLMPVFEAAPRGPVGNCGRLYQMINVQLVDLDTQEIINEAHKSGELWIKPNGFAGYYNMAEATKEAFAPDGWFKTGDILYRDDDGYFYYVDRIKMLIKYKNNHIIPCELETVLRTHPGVVDVAVTSTEDPECGEIPVACVVRSSDVTAIELINLVSEKLSEYKQLRGGVVFVDDLPLTSTGKIAKNKLRQMVKTLEREF